MICDELGKPFKTNSQIQLSFAWRHSTETAEQQPLSRNTSSTSTTELSTTRHTIAPTQPSASLLDYLSASPILHRQYIPARAQLPPLFNISEHRQDGSRGDHDCVCPSFCLIEHGLTNRTHQDQSLTRTTASTTRSLLVTVTTCPHAGRRKPTPPT